MRVLATIGFSFSAGVFLAALLPWNGWQLYAAGGVLLLALAWLFAARKQKYFRRGLLILLPLAVSLAYFAGYDHLVRQPIEDRCGAASDFTATVCDWPQATERGARVTVELEGYHRARAVLYGEAELLAARPGDTVTGTAQWQSAAHFDSDDVTHFNARGVYTLLYGREDVRLSAGDGDALRWLPQRAGKAFREKVAAIWDDPRVSGFLTAELTGDKSAMDDGDYLAMQETSLAHLFAVSGLHCAFLVTLLALLISRRQRLLCAVTIPLLLFYMVMVGMSPSVVRACIMQIFLLIAPLFRRGSDPLTSLAAALLVILLCNPFAAASVSLQLSFSATLGMVLLSPRLYKLLPSTAGRAVLRRGEPVRHPQRRGVHCPTDSLVFPHFRAGSAAVQLIGGACGGMELHGCLCDGAAGLCVAAAGQPAGLDLLGAGAVHPVDRQRHDVLALSRGVFHQSLSHLLAAVFVRGLYRLCRHAGRQAEIPAGIGIVGADADGETALVDCGSSNSYKDPGGLAADTLHSMGVRELSAVVVTHYHADHTNGLYEVLRRIPVQTIYLPDIEDEYGVRERLVSLAEEKGAQVTYVTKETADTLGDTVLTIYPPVQSGGDLNELGLTALASAGDFDLLITGDMSGSTEKKLVETYALPDIEVLVVSHHGSRYSSNIRFLKSVTPEAAVISVGDNNYGHPSEETLQRLLAVGVDIWRTDQQGTIRITVNGG